MTGLCLPNITGVTTCYHSLTTNWNSTPMRCLQTPSVSLNRCSASAAWPQGLDDWGVNHRSLSPCADLDLEFLVALFCLAESIFLLAKSCFFPLIRRWIVTYVAILLFRPRSRTKSHKSKSMPQQKKTSSIRPQQNTSETTNPRRTSPYFDCAIDCAMDKFHGFLHRVHHLQMVFPSKSASQKKQDRFRKLQIHLEICERCSEVGEIVVAGGWWLEAARNGDFFTSKN